MDSYIILEFSLTQCKIGATAGVFRKRTDLSKHSGASVAGEARSTFAMRVRCESGPSSTIKIALSAAESAGGPHLFGGRKSVTSCKEI